MCHHSKLTACLAVGLLLYLPSVVRAIDVRIENQCDEPLDVAVAYEKGNPVVEGWFVVQPHMSRNFSASDAAGLYLRVEKNRGEVTWSNAGYSTFVFFPACQDRFSVSRPTDDPSLRFLRSGKQLERLVTIRESERLPVGWDSRRFFRVGPGMHSLRVNP